MQVLGHVAAGTLAAAGFAGIRARPVKVSTVLLPAALGGITPDLLDKAILALGWSVFGRTVGHSLVFLAVAAGFWVLLRASRARAAGAILGFWILGVGTHLAADVVDDVLRGVIHGGNTLSSFFAWPFADPYAWVVRNSQPLGVWPWAISPLEVAVLGGAALWLALAGRRAWVARTAGGVSAETRGSASLGRVASFATLQLKRGRPGGRSGGGP